MYFGSRIRERFVFLDFRLIFESVFIFNLKFLITFVFQLTLTKKISETFFSIRSAIELLYHSIGILFLGAANDNENFQLNANNPMK